MWYLLLFFGCSFITILIRFIFEKRNISISKMHFKWMIIAHLFMFTLFISALILAHFEIYFRGYHSHSYILLLLCLIGTISFWVMPEKEIRSKVLIFSFAIIEFLCLIAIPILTGIFSGTDDLYFDSSKYRIEATYKGFLAPAQLPDLFIKGLIFEKKFLVKGPYIQKAKITAIKISELTNDSVEVKFYHTDTLRSSISSPLICKIKIE
jgi:hypothetical protein